MAAALALAARRYPTPFVSDSLINRSLSLEMKACTRFSSRTRRSGLNAWYVSEKWTRVRPSPRSSSRVNPSACESSGRPTAVYFHDSFGVTSVSHSHDWPLPPVNK